MSSKTNKTKISKFDRYIKNGIKLKFTIKSTIKSIKKFSSCSEILNKEKIWTKIKKIIRCL